MTRTHLVLATLCGSIALTGCMDSKPTASQETVIIEPKKRDIAHRDAALTLDKKSRAGAAYVEGGYTHVLATRNDTKLNDRQSALIDPTDLKAIADEAKSLMDGQTKKRDASIYTSARVERFCGQGKMTADDCKTDADTQRYVRIRSQSISPNMACPSPALEVKQASSTSDETLFKPLLIDPT